MGEQPSEEKRWQVILTLVISVLGFLYFLGQSLLMGFVWFVSLISPQTGLSGDTSLNIILWSSILSAVLLIPTMLISTFQLRRRPIPPWLDTSRPVFSKITSWIILVWPLIVFAGWFISGRPNIAAFLIGPLNLLAAGIPVLWIYHKAQTKLDGGSQIRKWRIFGFSLTIMPLIVIVVEVVAFIILVFLLLVGIQLVKPQFGQAILQALEMLQTGSANMDEISRLIEPFLRQPIVVYGVFALMAGVIPAIEELLKPMALWALAGKKISPQEGFVGGLIAGAGFALIENVLYFTNVITAGDWLVVAVGRAGTGILHMLASGIAGWGLAKGWRDRKWWTLIFSTLGAILLHGLWNGLAIASGFLPFMMGIEETTLGQDILYNAPLVILMILSAVGIFLINRHFQKKNAAEIKEDPLLN